MAREIEYRVNENGCHICTSHATNSRGYPLVHKNKKSYSIHRMVYEQYKGEIPEGLVVRHTCDNRMCINPAHLVVGTQKENMRDMVERGRSCIGERNGRAKITEAAVRDIRQSQLSVNELSEKYGIDSSTVRKIRRGKLWKHIA